MKTKFFILSTIATGAIAMISNQAIGANCYNAEACTGSPKAQKAYVGTLPGANDNVNAQTKLLQTAATEKFVGTVKAVNRVNLPNQTQIQMVLSTDAGDLLVILGPASFIDKSKVQFEPGDKVTVSGYSVVANNNKVILAAKIDKNGTTLQLLNEDRRPLWLNRQEQSQTNGQQNSQSYSQNKNGNSYSQMPQGQSYSGSQHPYMPNSRS